MHWIGNVPLKRGLGGRVKMLGPFLGKGTEGALVGIQVDHSALNVHPNYTSFEIKMDASN